MGKNLIPNFSNCTIDRKSGDLWCYDKTEKDVYRIEKPARKNIPQDVLFDLLQAANED